MELFLEDIIILSHLQEVILFTFWLIIKWAWVARHESNYLKWDFILLIEQTNKKQTPKHPIKNTQTNKQINKQTNTPTPQQTNKQPSERTNE